MFHLPFSQYGLYGSFLGCFVYIFIGSCKDVPMGPTALAALLTFQAAGGSWQKSALLCFLTGLIEILMGVFQLGFIIDFVSGPVGSGFTSAASMIILSSQVKDLIGVCRLCLYYYYYYFFICASENIIIIISKILFR